MIYGLGGAALVWAVLFSRDLFALWEEVRLRRQFGSLFRETWMERKVRALRGVLARRRAGTVLLRDLADFLDLFSLALSTGLPFQQAFAEGVHAIPPGFLKKEMETAVVSLRLGRSKEEVLQALRGAVGDPQVDGVLVLLHQSVKRGMPLQEFMGEEADFLRNEYGTRIEKQMQTAPLRLLAPIMIFLFPTLFILLIGSLLLQLGQSGPLF